MLDVLKQIYTKSLPNWIDAKSILLSWINSTLSTLETLYSEYLTEADYVSDSAKAKSNWLCNHSIYVDKTNIPSFDTQSFVYYLTKRGTLDGLIEASYYLDGTAGSYTSGPPVYTLTEADSSLTWTSPNLEATIYKPTCTKISTHFWIADTSSPSDANFGEDYVGPSVSHMTLKILLDRTQQSRQETQTFIRKHFIPAGLPVVFI